MIRQDNEYNRTMDYIKIMNDNIARYKRIIASNQLKSDTLDADVKNIISRVGAAMPKLFEQSTAAVRDVSNALSAIIVNFEYYIQYKKELSTENFEPWMSKTRINMIKDYIKECKNKISKYIDTINGYLNRVS